MTLEEKQALKELVDRTAHALHEHVDNVTILVNSATDDGTGDTFFYEKGVGNYYARIGQMEEHLERVRKMWRCDAERDWKIREEEE